MEVLMLPKRKDTLILYSTEVIMRLCGILNDVANGEAILIALLLLNLALRAAMFLGHAQDLSLPN